MFKKIVHYFTSSSLEKHRFKTQCMIEEYERAAAESQVRLQDKAHEYESALQSWSQRHEQELQAYVEFLEAHLSDTTEHVAQLWQLQEMMFSCLGKWMEKSLCEQRLRLQSDKNQLMASNIALLDAFEEEILRLSQQEGREAWTSLVSKRAPRVSTPKIDKLIERFESKAEREARAYQDEIRRIRSHKSLLRRQLNSIRAAQAACRQEVNRARDEFRRTQQTLRALYANCCQGWSALQKAFENYYRDVPSDSSLANKWLLALQDGGTLREIRQVIIDTNDDWQAAKEYTAELRKQMSTVKERIASAHNLQDFSTLDSDKSARSGIHQSLEEARAHQNALYEARQVFFTRRDEINAFLGWIGCFHPSKTVEQVFRLLSQDDPELYWKSIGLSTKTIRSPARSEQ